MPKASCEAHEPSQSLMEMGGHRVGFPIRLKRELTDYSREAFQFSTNTIKVNVPYVATSILVWANPVDLCKF